jgi:translation initiation factor IF-1
MVKNTKGGNKTKKQKRGFQKKEALTSITAEQMFGQVIENKGDHFMILCADNVTRLGWLSSAAKKGLRLFTNSFVVLSIRDYETNKKNCDVIAAGEPPNDVKNLFRKINPLGGGDTDVIYYTQNDKFKEFEESKESKESKELANDVVIINHSIEKQTNNLSNNDLLNVDWLDDTDKDIYNDPKAFTEEIDWSDI